MNRPAGWPGGVGCWRRGAALRAVAGALPARGRANPIRGGFDPSARPGLSALAAHDPDRADVGVHPNSAWPAAAEESWAGYQADGTVHATYWVEEWPRIPV